MIESWAYSVSVIDDDASQADFDEAAAAADTGYLTGEVNGGSIGTKLTDSAIGLVTEQQQIWNELELCSSSDADTSNTDVQIVENSHYITSPFAVGPVTAFTTEYQSKTCVSSPAADLVFLAEASGGGSGGPTLATLETGATRLDGQPSTGRRVTTPWVGKAGIRSV